MAPKVYDRAGVPYGDPDCKAPREKVVWSGIRVIVRAMNTRLYGAISGSKIVNMY